jgi:hypothetical protein
MLKKTGFLLILPMICLCVFQTNAQPADPMPKKSSLKSEAEIPCKVIREIRYPVTQTEPYKQPLRIALLNVCPADPGAEARPMLTFFVNDEPVMREYVVEKVFADAKEARKYAKKNKIKDAVFPARLIVKTM